MIPDANRSILYAVASTGYSRTGILGIAGRRTVVPWQQPPGSDPTDQSGGPHPNPLPEGEGTSDSGRRQVLIMPENSPAFWSRRIMSKTAVPSVLAGDTCRTWPAAWFTTDSGCEASSWLGGRRDLRHLPFSTSQLRDRFLASRCSGRRRHERSARRNRSSGRVSPRRADCSRRWLDASQTVGMEASYLQFSRQTEFFNASGVSTPVLARPFFNSETGQQDSQIINFPGQQSGTFSSAFSTELPGRRGPRPQESESSAGTCLRYPGRLPLSTTGRPPCGRRHPDFLRHRVSLPCREYRSTVRPL